MPEIMARGPNFVYAKEFITQRYGEELWSDVMHALPRRAAEIWSPRHLITEEYPFSAFKAMVQTLCTLLDDASEHQLADMYAYIADRSLNSIYKVFFRFSQPASVIKNYPKLWKRFFSVGIVNVLTAERGHATLEFILPEIFLDWLPSACYGFSKKAVEMAGGRELQQTELKKTKSHTNSWEITYELFWQE
jgi:hypothetical protein